MFCQLSIFARLIRTKHILKMSNDGCDFSTTNVAKSFRLNTTDIFHFAVLYFFVIDKMIK